MKFKTYQSAIGIFIVSIMAIFLYIFLENDVHKRIVVYSGFSVIIVWCAVLISHRRKTAKKLRSMTKTCILNQNSTGEFCDGVKRRMARYAIKKGKTYELIAEEIRAQILNKKGAGWFGKKKAVCSEHYNDQQENEYIDEYQPQEFINHDVNEYQFHHDHEYDYLVTKILDCISDEKMQGQICDDVVNAVKMYAEKKGKSYEDLASNLRKEAFKKLTIQGKSGGNNEDHDYGEFAGASGYGEF